MMFDNNNDENATNLVPRRRCFTVGEVSDLTTLSKATIRNLIRDRKLQATRLGRRIVIRSEDLDRFLSAQPSY